jgi:hypothetical protein
MANAEIGRRLGMNESQISSKAFKLQLFKSEDFKYRSSMKSAFRIGHVPSNKGKKMSPAIYKKAKAIMFKKGHLPHNAVGFKDGDISIRYDHKNRGGKAYKYIRLALGKWYPLHQHVWEIKHGRLPKGHCLWFKDKDPMNCRLSNLQLITRGENMRRNSCSRRLTDGYVAATMARVGAGTLDKDLLEILLRDKKLIEAKRQYLLLKRTINDTEANTGKA